MHFTEWEILLVDDEPDVLAATKLAMKNLKVYGLPLKIHTASSAAEAKTIMSQDDAFRHSGIAVALIDVVMETDDAGLSLCQAIREELGNLSVQLYIRTGQPGLAPERDVIDTLNINGYFTKHEATEDKLYTLLKSGIRQYYWIYNNTTLRQFVNLVMSFPTREAMTVGYNQVLQGQAGLPFGSRRAEVGGTTIGLVDISADEAAARVAAMSQMEGMVLDELGSKYVIGPDDYHLCKIEPSAGQAGVTFLYQSSIPMPIPNRHMLNSLGKIIGTVWARLPEAG